MFRETVDVKVNHIAVVGNPNSGKTALFNALTGLRQKVGNYPGVTVEKKEGRIMLGNGSQAVLLDLPGTYSLTPNSPDEKIAVDVLLGHLDHTPPPAGVIVVVDASNLERNLYLLSQIIDCGLPVVVALNMIDVAQRNGVTIDVRKLSELIGVPVVPTVSTKGIGVPELKAVLAGTLMPSTKPRQWILPEPLQSECSELKHLLLKNHNLTEPQAFHESLRLLCSTAGLSLHSDRYAPEVVEHLRQDHERLARLGVDCLTTVVEARYEWIQRIQEEVLVRRLQPGPTLTDRIDRVLTHRTWGFVIFFGLMTLMFQTIFTWANVPMHWIGLAFNRVGDFINASMPPGDLRELIVHGAVAGVGAVVTFLPQILFLFFAIGVLEDTGYMARAAFMMDRIMSKVGLHGKSFIPMLSSFACAIPGIMSTRTIENRKDRLVTILVAPLVGCSARLPVYALMIAAFIPQQNVLGFFSLAGLTLVLMYLLGIVAALATAWLFKRTLLKSETPTFIMELPPYKLPSLRSVVLHMWSRSMHFLKRAGTIILGVSIILWFLATYPKQENASRSEQLRHSFAGQAGHLIEPVIKPLGFDWKIGLGLVGSLLQREIFVSTMGTIYGIENASESSGNRTLVERLQQDIDPVSGRSTYTLLTAICLMVFYVLAMQCLSTFAVVKRETNGWKWPLFQLGYMTALAYSVTFVVYRIGLFFL